MRSRIAGQQSAQARIVDPFDLLRVGAKTVMPINLRRAGMVFGTGVQPNPLNTGPRRLVQQRAHQETAEPSADIRRHQSEILDLDLAGLRAVELAQPGDFTIDPQAPDLVVVGIDQPCDFVPFSSQAPVP